jgi:hypothetical protein
MRKQLDPPVPIRPLGLHYDLQVILDEVRRDYFTRDLEAWITWGRAPRRRSRRKRRSIVYASWWEELRLIRVHPALDRHWVPREFLHYLVYHELCHAVARPRRTRARRMRIHHPEFRALEAQYPDIERMHRLSHELLEQISRAELGYFPVGTRRSSR